MPDGFVWQLFASSGSPPGAMSAHFASPMLLLYCDLLPSLSSAPTTMALSAPPDGNTASLPAVITGIAPSGSLLNA